MGGTNPDRGKSVSTVLGRRLSGELLRMREQLGLKQADGAKALTASVAKVAKIERGLVPMRDPDIRALCHLYGERDEAVIGRLLELAAVDRDRRKAKGWWDYYADLRSLVEYVALEDIATQIRAWEITVLPGVLQTPDYARALALGSGAWPDPAKIEPFVEARMARKARLLGERPLELWVVLHEGVLRQTVGGGDVMKEQLSHLLDMSKRSNVKLQVVPYSAGAHPAMGIAFNIISFAEVGALDVVHMDTASSAVWLEGESDAKRHGQFFERLAQQALSQRDSHTLISAIIEEL
ncbi:helix-turn-helix domain-containing protein [Streptomyces corynorhini]|uniref:XRE family transcriptional regulator n=1 Tax=Streptomyces corynorhini TaxID=2282652 RepID=A0A370B2T9_9ACTN|nr:helix-turn-helix transcriptional regulator [Streptomyces corynorhini]RDG35901.1 XRE family transcriptional regulator [Streptomyces corynorhini]